jgi:hypothetical protein
VLKLPAPRLDEAARRAGDHRQGRAGRRVLRRAPEWLAAPHLAHIVAGISGGRPPPRRRGALCGAEAEAAKLTATGEQGLLRDAFLQMPSSLAGLELGATSSSETPEAARATSQW